MEPESLLFPPQILETLRALFPVGLMRAAAVRRSPSVSSAEPLLVREWLHVNSLRSPSGSGLPA